MNEQKIMRIICIVALQGLLLYEMIVIQGSFQWSGITESFRWYDYIVIIISLWLTMFSVIAECGELDDTDDDSYIAGRVTNVLICAFLLWKTINLQPFLPYTPHAVLTGMITIGLFTIFNFLCFLVSLLAFLAICFVWNYSGFDGFALFFAISIIIVMSLILIAFIFAKRSKSINDIRYLGRSMTCPHCRRYMIEGTPTNTATRGTIKTAAKYTVGGISITGSIYAGSELGAYIGTFFGPLYGTAIGGCIGGAAGFIGGCYATHKVNSKIDSNTEELINEISYYGNGVKLHFRCPCGNHWYRYEKDGEIVR